MTFDKGIGFPHRKKFSFAKLKLGHKHAVNNRKETASLPPNIKLNRENPMHIQVPTNEKFPWGKKDNSSCNSEDEDDRLSTISSREESRSGSEKRRKKSKQDSGCQTEADFYFVSRSSVRRRKAGHACDDSNGSINSDEFFLSLPVSDSTEHRGMYRLSPRHSDRSPLLGGYDSSLDDDRKGEDSYSPLNNLSNILVHENIISAEVPFNSQSLHPRRDAIPLKRTDESYVTSQKKSSECYHHNPYNNTDSSIKLMENGHLIQIDHVPLQNNSFAPHTKSPPTLQIAYSDLYKRRQLPQPTRIEEKSLDKSRNQFASKQNKTCVMPVNPVDGHCNCRAYDVIPEPHSVPRGPSVVSNTLSTGSTVSAEEMLGFGNHQLEEEEVSMLSFRDYMKNRGINLDLSDVQSSEV